MTDDNSTTSDGGENLVDIDLDSFSKDFFNPTDEKVEEKKPEDEEVNENEDDALATEKTDDDAEDENSEDNPDGDEAEEDEKPKPKKKTFQDRIDELTAKARNEERRAAELERRLAEIEARNTEVKTETPKPKVQVQEASAVPQPTDLDEDGEPKYKLGEFDPLFIRDLTKFTIDEERAKAKAEDAETAQKRLVEAAQEELKGSWLSKIEEAEKELPDLREHLGQVGEAFAGIDPNYGEFLAATIMTCDFGPQIMYYLSQNIGEAQKIVASGPAAATLAIGRLDAKFNKPTQGEKRNTNKASKAPEPPENRNRGSNAKSSVAADTSDLGAFEKEFFKKA